LHFSGFGVSVEDEENSAHGDSFRFFGLFASATVKAFAHALSEGGLVAEKNVTDVHS